MLSTLSVTILGFVGSLGELVLVLLLIIGLTEEIDD